ncbi:MAG: stage III sporulation protein AB [Clostridiales bacterium]|nr:stage III sporulation protein AB [Clostridiales bacterium]MCF8021169.1 stage III sporulation protein AB [Clostridiales bacterium]
MFKLIGALMIVSCTGIMGMIKAREYAMRPRELRSMQSALQMLETEIIYGATPLPEALEYVAERCEKNISRLFRQVEQELIVSHGCTVKEAWDRALYLYAPPFFQKGDTSILSQLGNCLGMSDREDQSKHLHLAMEQLKLETTSAKEKAKSQVKLWNYMGFLAGLMIVTILY